MARVPGRGGSGGGAGRGVQGSRGRGAGHAGHAGYGGRGGGWNPGGPDEPGHRERGVPDGLLLGVISFLLGLTLLVWSATGLAGLFSHGAWPTGVSFVRTPKALRHLVTEPHDLAAAWPETPPEELSGYGLFWGILISQLMVLFVLTVFAIGTVARYRIVRARRRAEAAGAWDADDDSLGHPGSRPRPRRRQVPEAEAGWEEAEVEYTGTGAVPPGRVPSPRSSVRHKGGGWAQSGGPGAAAAHGSGGAHFAAGPGTSAAGTGAAMPGPGHPNAHESTAPSAPGAVDDRSGSARAGTGDPGPSAPAGDGTVPSAHDAFLTGTAGTAGTAASAAPAATGHPAHPVQPPTGPTPTTPVAHGAAGLPGGPGGGAVPGPRATPFPSPEPSLPRIVYGTQRGDAALRTVLDADGPILVVTSDPDLWSATKDSRAKLGPVHVYDPTHRLDTPARLRWHPAAGCEAREAAAARAAALLAPVRPTHALDRPTADAAETLLRCWLHAAAVDGRPFRQVHRWAQGHGAHEPVRILRTHPKAAGGAAGELEATLTAHPERRDQAQELTARTLSALSSIHIRDACNPGRADVLALESFIPEGGTLYLVGESIEDPRTHPSAMPLLTALLSSVVERGRRMAERSSSGRLDPPVTLVLDDIAAVAPLPALPDLIAQGAAQGLLTLALMRSQEQARTRWPNRALVR